MLNRASFDIDGVIFMGKDMPGIYPGIDDVIITGRSIEEEVDTISMLRAKRIYHHPYFNPISYQEKTRESSAHHKVKVINGLNQEGKNILYHYDDDPIQIQILREAGINVIEVNHNLLTKENVRHEY